MEEKLQLEIKQPYIYPGYYRKRKAVYDVNNLTAELVNASSEAIAIDEDLALVLELPIGDGATDLVLDGKETELQVTISREDLILEEAQQMLGYLAYRIVPAAAEAEIAPGERVTVQIKALKSPIQEDEKSKMTHLRLSYGEATVYAPIYKRMKAQIVRFALKDEIADPQGAYRVGYGDTVTVEWEIRGCESCVLYPYRWTNWENDAWRESRAVLPTVGSVEVAICGDTQFTLRAVRAEEADLEQSFLVKLAGAEQLESFSVMPERQPLETGNEVTFAVVCAGARHAYVDRGIGRIAMEKQPSGVWKKEWQYSRLTNKKMYTATVRKADAFDRKRVKAGIKNALELADFGYEADWIGGEWKHYVRWSVANSDGAVKLTTSDGTVRSENKAEGEIEFTGTGTAPLTLTVEARQKSELGQQVLYLAELYPKPLKEVKLDGNSRFKHRGRA